MRALRDWLAGNGGVPITHIAVGRQCRCGARKEILVTQRYIQSRAAAGVLLCSGNISPSASSSANGVHADDDPGITMHGPAARCLPNQCLIPSAGGVAKTANNQITVQWIHSFSNGRRCVTVAYSPTTWNTNDVITKDKLNKIGAGDQYRQQTKRDGY